MINSLDIYRAGSVIATIDIDASTVFNEKLQGTKLISCAIKNPVAIPIQPEDYIIYKDERFTCNIVPEFTKDSETLVKEYSIVFEAEFYHLLDWYVEDEGERDISSYYGTALDHLNLVIGSANGNSSGWAVGEVDVTTEESIPYSWVYARTAIDDIATKFGLEYQFTGKTIRMVKSVGRDTGLSFQMGRGQGLHQIKRSPDTSKSAVNRVYGIGGTKNIDSTYRDGTKTSLIFDGEFVQTAEVTAWLAGTGPEVRIKEGKYVNEERYPHFKGTVATTTVLRDTAGKIISATITDPALDFDINAQLLPETKAHVSFLTGEMTGVDFEIASYVVATKTITIIPNTDANGYVLPNDISGANVGDKFTLIDIKMPVQYITNEEGVLRNETQTYLDDNEFDRLIYAVKPDEKVLRDNSIVLKVGDTAEVVDSEMEVNDILRFVEISYPLVNEFDVSGVIGNQIIYDRVIKLFADVQAVHQQIQFIDRRGQEIAKRNAFNLRVLESSVFDTDGLIRPDKINVGVLSADLGIFGTKSQDFLLSGVYITDNYLGDANAVSISSGELIHLEISNPGNQNVWQMQPLTQNGLIPASRYYVYSKISKTAQVGSFIVTTDQITYDSVSGFYMLLTGIIYPVNGTYRDSEFTNGIADINGNRLKIGIIRGVTGALVINLNTGEIFGKLTFRGSNGATVDVSDVNNTATLAQANALAAQTLADNANNQATTALAELTAISSDGILDVSEKTTLIKDLKLVTDEYASVIASANKYSVPTTDYTAQYNRLVFYANSTEAWNLNQQVNTNIDRVFFDSVWNDYYKSRQAVYDNIASATKGLIDGIQVGTDWSSGKMLYRDPEFSGAYGQSGYNGINTYNNTGSASVNISRGTNGRADFGNAGLPVLPNGSNCYINIYYNGDGNVSPGYGGFYFANQSRANAKFITRIVALLPIGYRIQWAGDQAGDPGSGGSVIWNTSQLGTGKWEEYIVTVQCGAVGQFSSINFFYIDLGPNIAFSWYLSYASVFDMSASEIDYANDYSARDIVAINTANSTAASIAQTKVDASAITTLANASSAAQSKVDSAYNALIIASQNYSNNIGNAAAADASNKAAATLSSAQSYADQQRAALTAQLGGAAFRSIQMAAGQGVTVVDNGSVLTFLVDAAYVRANVVNADYVMGLNLNFTQGTIGGINMSGSSIYSSNGNFSVDSAGNLVANSATISGTINASSGTIGGFNISSGKLTNGSLTIDPTNNQLVFISGTVGGSYSAGAIGSYANNITGSGFQSPGIFINHITQSVSNNIALTASAKNASGNNIALDIPNGTVRVANTITFTGYVSFSGNIYDKYIAGYFIGRGNGQSF